MRIKIAGMAVAIGLLAGAHCQQNMERVEVIMDQTIERITVRTQAYIDCLEALDIGQIPEALAVLQRARELGEKVTAARAFCLAPADPEACAGALAEVAAGLLGIQEAAQAWCPRG